MHKTEYFMFQHSPTYHFVEFFLKMERILTLFKGVISGGGEYCTHAFQRQKNRFSYLPHNCHEERIKFS